MSHVTNLVKMGYVPTPPLVVERVAAFLCAEGACHLLDVFDIIKGNHLRAF
jgi:hypothetical protein